MAAINAGDYFFLDRRCLPRPPSASAHAPHSATAELLAHRDACRPRRESHPSTEPAFAAGPFAPHPHVIVARQGTRWRASVPCRSHGCATADYDRRRVGNRTRNGPGLRQIRRHTTNRNGNR